MYSSLQRNIKQSRPRHLHEYGISYIRQNSETGRPPGRWSPWSPMADKRKIAETAQRRLKTARRVVRLALVAVVSLLVVFVVSRAAAPYLISSGLVRSAMERAVAHWTGHKVTIAGTSEISFWPTPRVTLDGVTITKTVDGGAKALGRIERLSASFGLYSAIQGNPHFGEFHLLRPRFHVDRDRAGKLDWASEGLLSAAVREVTPLDGGRQALPPELNAQIGSITIEDGSIELQDEASGHLIEVGAIFADVSWPRLSDELRAAVLLKLGGLDMKLDLASRQPLLLFGGKDASVRAAFGSTAFDGTFDGVASLVGGELKTGSLALSAKDIPALRDWSGIRLAGLDSLTAASLTAKIERVGPELRLEDLDFDINDTHGTGILSVLRRDGAKPRVSGTVAFDRLNITRLLAAFSLDLPSTGEGEKDEVRLPRLLQWLDFDLTLSATRADLPPFELDEVAASILATENTAQFDIADAVFEGGDLTASFSGGGSGFSKGGDLGLSIHDADFAAVAEHLAIKGPVPQGKGSVELSLKTAKPVWATGLSDMSGTVAFTSKAGILTGVDPAAIRAHSANHAYFQLSATNADAGSMPYERLTYKARYSNGTAEIEEASLVGADETLTLAGVIPYASNGLALSAELSATDPTREPEFPRMRFFLGGSWPDPVITPIYPSPAKPLK